MEGDPWIGRAGPDTRHTTEEGLAKILAQDDLVRAATSQPGRWSQMPWKSP